MKKSFLAIVISSIFCLIASHASAGDPPLKVYAQDRAARISTSVVDRWVANHNGRLKPFGSLARETMLFLTGRYSLWGIHPTALMVFIMSDEKAEQVALIEVRSPELRKQLLLPADRRHFSIEELQKSNLQQLANPLLEKQKQNKRLLTEAENKIIEAADQMWLATAIQNKNFAIASLSPDANKADHGDSSNLSAVIDALQRYFATLDQPKEAQDLAAGAVESLGMGMAWPDNMKAQISHRGLELFYNKVSPFSFAAWLFFLCALALFVPQISAKIPKKFEKALLALPLVAIVIGLIIRVYITGFAPVTNMYGTMIWVALGVGGFAWAFFLIYANRNFTGFCYIGAFLLLLLTSQIPLILSPDMDPIVAVLRSNFWLTIHVLTITISYAAFTMAMILGNVAAVKKVMGKLDNEWITTYGHLCYRSIQLGVFLLSIGIILGGVWADYSWGRFWGWDPKETWALIADLGFLVLLHARFVGWITPLRMLLLSPVSYLLVIMAWYGVNFILATGLHSYGFSSGGALLVTIFVVAQLLLLAASALVGLKQKTS